MNSSMAPSRGSSFEGRMFFVYDREAVKKEEDPPEDAILYFYPHYASVDDQVSICGQIVGMTNFLSSFLGASPILFKLETEKVAIFQAGQYTLALGGTLNEPDSLLIRQQETLYNLFAFYHGCIDRVREMCTSRSCFLTRLNTIWECYLPFVRHYGDSLPAVFDPLPFLETPKNTSSCFLKASHILQTFQRRHHILGGCILYSNSVLCTQLDPALTKRLLLLKPNQSHHPAKSVKTDINLPFGVRILNSYVTLYEYQHLFEALSQSPYRQYSAQEAQSRNCLTTCFRPESTSSGNTDTRPASTSNHMLLGTVKGIIEGSGNKRSNSAPVKYNRAVRKRKLQRKKERNGDRFLRRAKSLPSKLKEQEAAASDSVSVHSSDVSESSSVAVYEEKETTESDRKSSHYGVEEEAEKGNLYYSQAVNEEKDARKIDTQYSSTAARIDRLDELESKDIVNSEALPKETQRTVAAPDCTGCTGLVSVKTQTADESGSGDNECTKKDIPPPSEEKAARNLDSDELAEQNENTVDVYVGCEERKERVSLDKQQITEGGVENAQSPMRHGSMSDNIKERDSTTECDQSTVQDSTTECDQSTVQDSTTERDQSTVQDSTTECDQSTVQDSTTECDQSTVQDSTTECDQSTVQDSTTECDQSTVQDSTTERDQSTVQDSTTECDQSTVQDSTTECDQSTVQDSTTECDQSTVQDSTTECDQSTVQDSTTERDRNTERDDSAEWERTAERGCTKEHNSTTEDDHTIEQDSTTERVINTERDCTTERVSTTERDSSTERDDSTELERTAERGCATERDRTTDRDNTTERDHTTEPVIDIERDCTTERNSTTELERTTEIDDSTEWESTAERDCTIERDSTTECDGTTEGDNTTDLGVQERDCQTEEKIGVEVFAASELPASNGEDNDLILGDTNRNLLDNDSPWNPGLRTSSNEIDSGLIVERFTPGFYDSGDHSAGAGMLVMDGIDINGLKVTRYDREKSVQESDISDEEITTAAQAGVIKTETLDTICKDQDLCINGLKVAGYDGVQESEISDKEVATAAGTSVVKPVTLDTICKDQDSSISDRDEQFTDQDTTLLGQEKTEDVNELDSESTKLSVPTGCHDEKIQHDETRTMVLSVSIPETNSVYTTDGALAGEKCLEEKGTAVNSSLDRDDKIIEDPAKQSNSINDHFVPEGTEIVYCLGVEEDPSSYKKSGENNCLDKNKESKTDGPCAASAGGNTDPNDTNFDRTQTNVIIARVSEVDNGGGQEERGSIPSLNSDTSSNYRDGINVSASRSQRNVATVKKDCKKESSADALEETLWKQELKVDMLERKISVYEDCVEFLSDQSPRSSQGKISVPTTEKSTISMSSSEDIADGRASDAGLCECESPSEYHDSLEDIVPDGADSYQGYIAQMSKEIHNDYAGFDEKENLQYANKYSTKNLNVETEKRIEKCMFKDVALEGNLEKLMNKLENSKVENAEDCSLEEKSSSTSSTLVTISNSGTLTGSLRSERISSISSLHELEESDTTNTEMEISSGLPGDSANNYGVSGIPVVSEPSGTGAEHKPVTSEPGGAANELDVTDAGISTPQPVISVSRDVPLHGDEEEEKDLDTISAYWVDGMVHINLYVQAHSDIVLILLAEPTLHKDSDTIKALWRTTVNELGELEFRIQQALGKQASQGFSEEYSFLVYDAFCKTMKGNQREPITSVDHVFCDTAKTVHEHFNNCQSLRSITLRGQTSAVYGQRSLDQEVYYQKKGSYRSAHGVPSPRDPVFNLERRAGKVLHKEHGVNVF